MCIRDSPYSIPLCHHLGWEIVSNKISFNIKDRQIPTKVQAPGYVRRVAWDNTDFHELHSHFASVTHGCLFRNNLAWEEYWRWDEDDTNVAVYYNMKDKPCGYMVYLIKNCLLYTSEGEPLAAVFPGEGEPHPLQRDRDRLLLPRQKLRQAQSQREGAQGIPCRVFQIQAVSYTHLDVYKRQG